MNGTNVKKKKITKLQEGLQKDKWILQKYQIKNESGRVKASKDCEMKSKDF